MIKSDKWIATRSTPPSHILHTVHGRETKFAWEGITHTKEQLRTMQERYMATRISSEDLQKEGWVPMIEPFERRQVRFKATFPWGNGLRKGEMAVIDSNNAEVMLQGLGTKLTEDDKFLYCNGELKTKVLEWEGELYHSPERVISYGNSSYGYDVRLSEEFKLFTNINSAVIDPKRFDEKCLIDAELKVDPNGDKYVILPPNSYLLGRTIEYFRIPRNVTVVAVGKCLAGDTLITNPETGEICRMDQTADLNAVQGVNDSATKVSVYSTEGLICNGELPMVTLKTRLGMSITATETHPLRKWGGWTPISELRVGDRIAIAREERVVGKGQMSPAEARLLGFMTADGQCNTPGRSPIFTKVDPTVMSRFTKDAIELGFVVSIMDNISVRLVNRLGRGGKMEPNKATQWLAEHSLNKHSAEKSVPLAIQTCELGGVRNYLNALFTCAGSISFKTEPTPRGIIEYYTTSELLAKQVQTLLRRFGLFFSYHHSLKTLEGKKYPLHILRTTNPETIHKFHTAIGFVEGSLKQVVLKQWVDFGYVSKRSNWDTLPPEAWSTIDTIFERMNISYASVGIHPKRGQSVSVRQLQEAAIKTGDQELYDIAFSDVIWDTVKSIEVANKQLAYDYTVPEVHNFIANGMIVHNSTYARAGAIVNVTPIEAEFEGNVVIEISNSTNLPLKIYANEGISQFLFFQSDEDCETSYADRDGKYMYQEGVVVPRV